MHVATRRELRHPRVRVRAHARTEDGDE